MKSNSLLYTIESSVKIKKDMERFWKYVDIGSSCWTWKGQTVKKYSVFQFKGRVIQAHRFIYQIMFGKINDHLELDHLCRNTLCVNPYHLDPVTHRDNVLRGVGISAQNSRKTHCIRGHELIGDNLTSSKNRECRICKNKSNKNRIKKLQEKLCLIQSNYCIISRHRMCNGIIRKSGGKCTCQCH